MYDCIRGIKVALPFFQNEKFLCTYLRSHWIKGLIWVSLSWKIAILGRNHTNFCVTLRWMNMLRSYILVRTLSLVGIYFESSKMDVLRKGRLVKQKLLFDYLHSSTNSSNSVLPFTTGWDKIWAVLWGICVNFSSKGTTISFINQMSCEISKVFSGLKHHKAIWKSRYFLIYLN